MSGQAATQGPGGGALEALDALARLPGVAAAVEEAREACTELRWHRALRRRLPECRAEAGVRAARCSAALDGGRLPLDLVRDAARGARELPGDASGLVVRGALRAGAEAERAPADGVAPWQWLARLHVAAAAGLVLPRPSGGPAGPGSSPATSARARRCRTERPWQRGSARSAR